MVGVGAGVGLTTATPLLHTSFLPLFTHVYFLLPTVIDWPAFLHTDPGFGAVAACAIVATKSSAKTGGSTCKTFFMYRQ